MSYWDSSALAKLYVKEADSQLFESAAAGAPLVPATSRLALYEFRTAFQRKESEGTLAPGAAQTTYQQLVQDVANNALRVVELSDLLAGPFERVIGNCFRAQPPIVIRTLDAIHLASALMVAESEIIATDQRLRAAAVSLGLRVFP